MSAVTAFAPARPFRFPLGALATFVVGTFFLSGVVHICTILLIPVMAEADGWSRLARFAGEDAFTEVPIGRARPTANAPDASSIVAGLDPLFLTGACRIGLAGAPFGITVDARDRFWTLALYDPKGTIIFSLNDRTAANGALDMLVVTTAQNSELKKAPPPDIDQTIVVESEANDLIAILRLFAPTPEAQAVARPILAGAECVPAPLDAPASGG